MFFPLENCHLLSHFKALPCSFPAVLYILIKLYFKQFQFLPIECPLHFVNIECVINTIFKIPVLESNHDKCSGDENKNCDRPLAGIRQSTFKIALFYRISYLYTFYYVPISCEMVLIYRHLI